MQTLIIEGSEFLNLVKTMCPKYQFYSCFYWINIRVRISEPCKIPIRQNFAKNANLDNRGVRISESFKTSVSKISIYSWVFLHKYKGQNFEPCKISIRQNFAKNANLGNTGVRISESFKTSAPKYQFYSWFLRINIRVRISEPCKIPIRQNFAKNANLDNRGVRISESFKTSVSKISIL